MPDISAVEDTSEAQWFVEGLDRSCKTVGGLVPVGYEAYARILHPAWRVRREDDRLVRSPVRWAEVATLRGTVAHRLMQWPQVWALPFFDDAVIAACADAGLAPIECPDEGRLPPQVAGPLNEVLAAYTGAPASCWFGVWIGFGWEYKDGIPATRRLSTGYREWDLFRAPLDALTLNFFITREEFYQSANVAWADDRSWCLATDIDMKSTYVGGTKALIDAILRHEALEAYVANADDPVWEDAKNPPGIEWNCRLGLIVDDDAMWRLPLRERIVSSIGRFVMRLARRNGRVGWNRTSR